MIRDFPRSSESLKTLFEIIEQTELQDQFKIALKSYIQKTGVELLAQVKTTMDEATLANYIQQIIDLKIKTSQVMFECFKDRKALRQEQIQAFKEFLNFEGTSDRNAQLLAVYINWQFK